METDIRKKLYIKVFYSLLDWEWIGNPNTLSVFIHLLLNANRKPKKYGKGEIKAGETLASLDFLSRSTGLSIQQVRTAIDHLISTNDITQRKVNNTNVFTIVSYNKWQSGNMTNNNATTNRQQVNNNSSTTRQQTDNNSSTTPIYCKNEENERLKECESEMHARGILANVFITDPEYDKFRSCYPETADAVIDELSAKIATGDSKYASGHIGHLYVFAQNHTPTKTEQPHKASYNIDLAMKRSYNIDPTKTKKTIR